MTVSGDGMREGGDESRREDLVLELAAGQEDQQVGQGTLLRDKTVMLLGAVTSQRDEGDDKKMMPCNHIVTP